MQEIEVQEMIMLETKVVTPIRGMKASLTMIPLLITGAVKAEIKLYEKKKKMTWERVRKFLIRKRQRKIR